MVDLFKFVAWAIISVVATITVANVGIFLSNVEDDIITMLGLAVMMASPLTPILVYFVFRKFERKKS